MADEKSNSELGTEYTAKILGRLLENWPRTSSLSCASITGIDYDEDAIFEGKNEPYPIEWEVCRELIEWLDREGFIRKGVTSGGSWYQYTGSEITARSMTVLKKTPDPLSEESNKSLSDAFQDIAKAGVNKATDKVVETALSALVAAAQTVI